MIRIATVRRHVAAHYALTDAEMLSPVRTRRIAYPRQIAMTLARSLTLHSRYVVGQRFGCRHPATVLHAERAVEARRIADPALDREVRELVLDLMAPASEAGEP